MAAEDEAPIFAMMPDGRICIRESDGRARRATEPNASCGCEGGPCYVRGACSFNAAPSQIAFAVPGFSFPASGYAVAHTAPSGGRWLSTVSSSGFGGGVVKARVWVTISPTASFDVEVKLYASDGVTVASTHTATVQGNCGGVMTAAPGDNPRWYDRSNSDGTFGVPTPTATAVTWSSGSGTFLWAAGDDCHCAGRYGKYGQPARPEQCRLNLADIVGRCMQTQSGSYIKGTGTPDGEYVLPLTDYGDGVNQLYYLLDVPVPAGMTTPNYGSSSTCAGTPGATVEYVDSLPGFYFKMRLAVTVLAGTILEVDVGIIRFGLTPGGGGTGYSETYARGIFYSRKTCHVPGELFYPQPINPWGGGTAELTLDDNDFA